MSTDAFEGWAIVDLMGHTRLAGKVTEVEMFGTKMGRIDVPGVEGKPGYTQFFGGGSVFRMTPTTEEIPDRSASSSSTPASTSPVFRWVVRPPAPAR